ncbi:HAD family hydrolase [Thiospirochaeta perfilievii]|uniref:HAD family hydrolase n=1 Tax=Thiospirochaeta perfilievii TaxID=252967 RepID=UPI001CAA14E5|nr:HAD family hydrolase [Thiospirochaeta perfilievii]
MEKKLIKLKKPIDSIIFDLDGTLWDPSNVILKAWKEVISSYPQVTKDITKTDLESLFGLQHDLISKKLFPYLEVELANNIMNECFEYENKAIKQYGGDLYSDLEEVLSKLSKNYNLYIVSNCQSGYIEAFFSYHKLEKYFIDFECSGNTGRPKNENIESIINRNSIRSTLYVGDTTGDLKAAELNNIPFIFATYGFGQVKDNRYNIDKLSDIFTLL